MNRVELTYEEFTAMPMQYTIGFSGDSGAHRMYRNEQLGIQKETTTKRKRFGDIYSGWKDPENFFYIDGDPREFHNAADCYEAYMRIVCKENT
jgi:hypothetical protein